MPEAEDVLLHGALYATRRVRALWQRLDDEAASGADRGERLVLLVHERRRIACWLEVAFGAAPPILACDAPPRPGWLARALGDRPPWAIRARAQAFSDGVSLFLPRVLESPADGSEPRERLLLMALGQARRATRGSLAALPREPLERDVFWALDGCAGDAWIAAHWPGLVPALGRERAAASRRRPPARALRPAERRADTLVRRLLRGDPGDGTGLLAELGAPVDAAPERLALLARPIASLLANGAGEACATERRRYRGMAAVPHWGVPRPDLVEAAACAAAPALGDDSQTAPGRSRSLPRRVETRQADPDELQERPGAFVLAFGEPELSLQDPAGVQRPRDRGDEQDLDAVAEELAQLDAAAKIRVPDPVREVLAQETPGRAGMPATGAASACGLERRFPEWDQRLGAYHRNRCRVRVGPAERLDAGAAERLLRDRDALRARLRRRFEALRPRRARQPRELDGDEVDLDGFVEDFADLRAGAAPAGRVYSVARPRRRDAAVVLLLDVSGSTDAQVHGAERVIDVEKAAALCFSEALTALGDRHAIYAFSGRGPDAVRVRLVKRFGEPLGDAVRARIGGLEPESFTRLGAVLRFAAGELARERARVRLLLVLSDGKPYDEDEYASEYGVADVRRAVAEAELLDVHPFCVTVDREGPSYLGRLFGAGRFTLLCNVAQLPERLPELYRRLTAGA